ncbi:serine/arginine repetitive matrix protein 1-like isoform X2 [Mercenaria mercenaria]|uniref:serine/arginine repetitive matrix protein 1-like isoform X2 n=1 Tax=Mercenaria mercenaria TaxID=6596 RepID=UPI00234E4A47|nr:serine/arginine repetitive matrix protein 1-like isoform X2 [Mercenaria mercenaria]
MQRRNPGATAALLQKANSQLKGEKIEKPEDELNAYISSLTQKTSKQQKTVNFEDLGDSISISSDIEDIPVKPTPEVASGSKFLKKKPSVGDQNVEPATSGNKFLKKPQVSAGSPSPAVKSQAQQRYGSQSVQSAGSSRPGSQLGTSRLAHSALDKASAITGKIQQRVATRKTYTLESDSDESFSAVKLSRSGGDQISESQNSKTDSVKIGRDGGKFMKKTTPSPAPVTEPPRTSTAQQNRGKSPAKQPVANQSQKKASPFQLKSSLKYSTDVVLTSEEESLAEFVGGLPSSSDSMDIKPKQQYGRPAGRHTPSPQPGKLGKGRRSPSPPPPNKSSGRPSSSKTQGRSVSPQNKPPMLRRTPSPSPRTPERMSPGLRRRSPSPKLIRSYSDDSNVAESIIDEVADDFGFNVIMDLDDLGPADEDEMPYRPETPISRSDSPSPVRSTARKTKKENKKGRGKKSSLKSTSETSLKEKKEHGSPFRASADREASVFKASKDKEKSPFKASSNVNESPFKARSNRTESPFKAKDKENRSPFRAADTGSPFKAKGESSPFRASNEGSLFKASDKSSSPFNAKSSDRSEKSEKSRSSSPFKSKGKTSKKAQKKKGRDRSKERSKDKKNKGTDLFSSFGLQTIDDLMGHSIKESEYDSVRSEVEEVQSEVSEEIRTEKPGAYSYSQRFEDTETEIATDYDTTKPSAANYTEDFDSISEKIGYSSDKGRSSASEVRTKYSGDETVRSETEFTESYTESVVSESKYTDDDEDKTYSDSYSEYSEDFTKSMVPTTSRSDVTPHPRRGMATAEVQTAMDGLLYSWDPAGTGVAFPGVPLGLHFVDPTPIATHVVSADSLEAMTAYSPAMLALHDMLKSQMELTQEFLRTQKQMYEDFTRNITPTFKYTTLEDTKKYIKKHRKKKLTFKEALQLVDLEMARR